MKNFRTAKVALMAATIAAGASLGTAQIERLTLDQMVSKTFADHRSEELILDFDALHGLDLEHKISRLTRWVLDANEQRLKYALRVPGTTIGPASGEEHRHQCLKTLAEYQG